MVFADLTVSHVIQRIRHQIQKNVDRKRRVVWKIRHPSPIATNWFQGSALEPTALQALPAEPTIIRSRPSLRCEAEPREQCIPRRSQGTRIKNGGDEREVTKILQFRRSPAKQLIRQHFPGWGCGDSHAGGGPGSHNRTTAPVMVDTTVS